MASGSNFSLGQTPDGHRLGPVALQAVGLLPGALSVLKKIRTPTWALGPEDLGSKKKDRASVLVSGGVSVLPPPFP